MQNAPNHLGDSERFPEPNQEATNSDNSMPDPTQQQDRRRAVKWAFIGAIEAAAIGALVFGLLYRLMPGPEIWVPKAIYGAIIGAIGGCVGGALYGGKRQGKQ